MLTPMAKVSVANKILMSPREKRISTTVISWRVLALIDDAMGVRDKRSVCWGGVGGWGVYSSLIVPPA